MSIYTKMTSQGQISVPSEVRKRLGLSAGSVLEWQEEGEKFFVRRLGKFSSEEIHQVLFPKGIPKPKTLAELKKGIRQNMQRRHARR